MADGNGNREWRDDMEDRVEALEKARRELEDSMMVMAQLEGRLSRGLREAAEWVAAHEPRIQRTETLMAEMTVKISEMTGKVDFLIDREMRREGGPETRE